MGSRRWGTLGTYNPEGGLTIVTTPEPNSGLMFGVCFLLGAIVLRGKFVSHIELSPTLSTRLCTDSAVGCEDHQLQLALPAPHVCQPSHNSRGGYSDGARASRPQDQRSDDALCPSRPKHTLAAVERLDVHTERSTDTTTDSRVVGHSHADVAVLL